MSGLEQRAAEWVRRELGQHPCGEEDWFEEKKEALLALLRGARHVERLRCSKLAKDYDKTPMSEWGCHCGSAIADRIMAEEAAGMNGEATP